MLTLIGALVVIAVGWWVWKNYSTEIIEDVTNEIKDVKPAQANTVASSNTAGSSTLP